MAAQAMAHLQRPAPQPSEFAPLTPAFDAVVGTAMAKDPAQRYATARQLAAAAAAALQQQTGLPPAAGPHRHGWTVTHPEWPPTAAGPTPRRGSKAAALAGAVLLVGAGVTASVVLRDDPGSAPGPTSGAPPAPTAAPTVTDSELPATLLPAEQVSAVMAVPMRVSGESGGFYNDGLVNVPECIAVLYPAQESAYQNSGATTTYTQIVNPVDTQIKASVAQAVVAFGTAALAESFVGRQVGLWQGCAGKTAKVSQGGGQPTEDWRMGSVTTADSVLTVTNTRVNSEVSCQRALRAANNVVVDVSACLTGQVVDQGSAVAAQIAGRVSGREGG